MNKTICRRVTARREKGFVVFLIGMRVNRWWKPWRWLPVALAMPPMLSELYKHPEMGFLGAQQWFGRTTMMVSYWESQEQLLRFATSRTATHLPAWQAFNQAIGTGGDVGIWHETYVVSPGGYENVYVNMPRFGLGACVEPTEAVGAYSRAAGRISAARP